MTLGIATDDVCSRCSRLIRMAFIARHPTIDHMAQRTLECAACGNITVVDLPLGPERESKAA